MILLLGFAVDLTGFLRLAGMFFGGIIVCLPACFSLDCAGLLFGGFVAARNRNALRRLLCCLLFFFFLLPRRLGRLWWTFLWLQRRVKIWWNFEGDRPLFVIEIFWVVVLCCRLDLLCRYLQLLFFFLMIVWLDLSLINFLHLKSFW